MERRDRSESSGRGGPRFFGDEEPDRFGEQIERRLQQTRLAGLFLQSPAFMAVLRGPEHVFVNVNPPFYELAGDRELIGRTAGEAFPELEGQGFVGILDRVYREGEPYVGSEDRVRLRRGRDGEPETLYVCFSYHPLRRGDGSVEGVLAHGVDVTERVKRRRRLRTRVRQRGALVELGRRLLDCTSVAGVFGESLEAAVEAVGADGGAVYRYDGEGERLSRVRASGGDDGVGWPRAPAVDSTRLVGRVFDEQAPRRVDATEGPQSAAGGPPPSSAARIAAPIPGTGSRPVGVLGVHAEGEAGFEEGSVSAIEAVAQIAGAAAERLESERFVSTVTRNLPGLVYRCRNDRDWTMEFLSEGTRDLTGYRPSELTERGDPEYADLIHPDDRKRVWREVQAAVEAGRPFQLQYRIRTRGGEEKWVWEQGRGVDPATGEPFLLEGYIFDVTEWRRARREAERTKSILFAAFQSVPDAIFVVNLPDRTIADCNAAAEGMFGYDRGEMLGESTELLHGGRGAFERFGVVSERGLEERGHYRGRSRMQRSDGSTFPAEHSVTYVETGSDQPDRSVSLVRDVTERERRKRELERSRKLLRQYNVHLTEALEQERAELAREVHDELGQSLTAAKLKLEEVRRRAEEAGETSERLEESVELIQGAIEQTRDLSTSLRPSVLDELGLIEALGDLTTEFGEKTGIAVEFDCSVRSLPPGPERGIHVYRIVQEALTNAARHSGADRVRVAVDRDGGRPVIRVRDDGAGVDRDDLESLDGHGVTGMRERARLLGGELTVRGREGGGTEVRLELESSAGGSGAG